MYQPPEYFQLDDLLTDEHKIIRSAVREWVDRSVKPIIEQYAQKHEALPKSILLEMGELGALGPFIPEKYGGGGVDRIAFGVIMTEQEGGEFSLRPRALGQYLCGE